MTSDLNVIPQCYVAHSVRTVLQECDEMTYFPSGYSHNTTVTVNKTATKNHTSSGQNAVQ